MQVKPSCGIVLGDAIAVIFVPLSVTISIFFSSCKSNSTKGSVELNHGTESSETVHF